MERLRFFTLAVAMLFSAPAWATEICGNSLDDDNNDVADEHCAPSVVSNVCESPLSCGDTGMVSWTTGALRYDLPPDIAPRVPYGPGIGFRRLFTSMSAPGANPSSVNKTPLGEHWQHTYLTYIHRYLGGDAIYRVVLHTTDGRDVSFKHTSTASSWESYTAQPGFHVMSMKRNTVSPYQYQLKLLTGETVVYNNVGQVIEIWDTLATPNKVLVTWDNTSNGNVSTVTDAAGTRRLLFSYSNGRMTSVQFQTFASSTWTTQHTTSYEFDNGVTRDATSGWFVPADATEWTRLLAGSGIANPGSLWGFQEASGNIADAIGGVTLASSHGGLNYQQTVTGWTRKAMVQLDTAGDAAFNQSHASLPALSTSSQMTLTLQKITNTPAAARSTTGFGVSTYVAVKYDSSNYYGLFDGTNTATGSVNHGTNIVREVLRYNRTAGTTTLFVENEAIPFTFSALGSGSKGIQYGSFGLQSPTIWRVYAAAWYGSAAELSDAQVATLIDRIKNGPGILTTVTIGGQLAQRNSYNSSGQLTKIEDGATNQIAAFAYSSTTNGQVNLITTTNGTVGFEFSSSRAACSGKTALYFNKGNTSSCDIDSDCGSGFLCGGKTGAGSTGTCFLAGRCLTTSSLLDEAIVTDVAPLGPGGGSCSGACTDVAEYVWTSSGSNLIRALGTEDPLGTFTSATYNANGLPTRIAYGDSDSDATNGGHQRIVYNFYNDASFPGRVTEVRRKSDISPDAGDCDESDDNGCAQTLFDYDADGLLDTYQELGFELGGDGEPVGYTHTTSYDFDAQGRIEEIDGPLSGSNDVTVFEYWSSSGDVLKEGFLRHYRRSTDSSNFLTQSSLSYDFWGNPTGMTDADGTVSCQSFDAARGYLTLRRETMAGQTSCTTNAADLVTSFERNAGLQLTKVTRPDGSCMFYEYDSMRRLVATKRRDDCNAGSSGDREEYTYSQDGLLTKIETFDASSTVTRRQELTYYQSRRLEKVLNPVDTSKWTGLTYDSRGLLSEVAAVSGGTDLSKTAWTYTDDRRVDTEKRYTAGSGFDTWNLLFDWIGNQREVEDGDSKVTTSLRDDLGRVTKLDSPDLGGFPTLKVYDAGNRLITVKEVFEGAGEQSHAFTFDHLGRPLEADYDGDCSGTNNADIKRVYDSIASVGGGTCPGSGTCANLAGRLAYVKVKLMCSAAYGDKSLDQETWFSYDAAGRLVREYIVDDTGRTAEHLFVWTKNGALAETTTPSSAVIGATFGSGGSNSDSDRITAVWRTSTSTPVIDNILWNPYGPLKQYNQMNTASSNALRTRIARNLAYRVTEVAVEKQSDGVDSFYVGISEDAKGRVITRDYGASAGGVQDSHFLYDLQDRVLCETTSSVGSCPTSGSNIKNSHSLSPPFTAAGDWKRDLRPIPGSTCLINDFSLASGTHHIDTVSQPTGTPTSCTPVIGDTSFRYDSRGDRNYEDNSSSLTYDRRDLLYDARHNVVNIRGRYYSSGTWRYYNVSSAFDAQNRRVYKSFYDETTTKTSTWFFYYDAQNRIAEIRHTPDISSASTYSIFQIIWLENAVVLYWQTDYPSASTTKRYVGSDEIGRPVDMISWPATGDGTRVWAIDPSVWGMDSIVLASTPFQPILLAGQYQDVETSAYHNDGATLHRPGVALGSSGSYDPFSASRLQQVATDREQRVESDASVVWDTWRDASLAVSLSSGAPDDPGGNDQRVVRIWNATWILAPYNSDALLEPQRKVPGIVGIQSVDGAESSVPSSGLDVASLSSVVGPEVISGNYVDVAILPTVVDIANVSPTPGSLTRYFPMLATVVCDDGCTADQPSTCFVGSGPYAARPLSREPLGGGWTSRIESCPP